MIKEDYCFALVEIFSTPIPMATWSSYILVFLSVWQEELLPVLASRGWKNSNFNKRPDV
jgi:hypothetical protein